LYGELHGIKLPQHLALLLGILSLLDLRELANGNPQNMSPPKQISVLASNNAAWAIK
jgi:hypothetical protein